MKPIQVVLTDRECELVDFLIAEGYAKSRADLLRKATLEYAVRHEDPEGDLNEV